VAAGVKVVAELDKSVPLINGDEGQLWQAVLNLVRNSLEAMPDGGTLTVRTARVRNNVVLTIADSGKGMSEDERQQIFKPFFSTKPSGTGLGLPLVQQVVAEHGGRIRCESAPNQGTTFIIELPYAEESTYAPKS
jgi:signal transduction histidine kinase